MNDTDSDIVQTILLSKFDLLSVCLSRVTSKIANNVASGNLNDVYSFVTTISYGNYEMDKIIESISIFAVENPVESFLKFSGVFNCQVFCESNFPEGNNSRIPLEVFIQSDQWSNLFKRYYLFCLFDYILQKYVSFVISQKEIIHTDKLSSLLRVVLLSISSYNRITDSFAQKLLLNQMKEWSIIVMNFSHIVDPIHTFSFFYSMYTQQYEKSNFFSINDIVLFSKARFYYPAVQIDKAYIIYEYFCNYYSTVEIGDLKTSISMFLMNYCSQFFQMFFSSYSSSSKDFLFQTLMTSLQESNLDKYGYQLIATISMYLSQNDYSKTLNMMLGRQSDYSSILNYLTILLRLPNYYPEGYIKDTFIQFSWSYCKQNIDVLDIAIEYVKQNLSELVKYEEDLYNFLLQIASMDNMKFFSILNDFFSPSNFCISKNFIYKLISQILTITNSKLSEFIILFNQFLKNYIDTLIKKAVSDLKVCEHESQSLTYVYSYSIINLNSASVNQNNYMIVYDQLNRNNTNELDSRQSELSKINTILNSWKKLNGDKVLSYFETDSVISHQKGQFRTSEYENFIGMIRFFPFFVHKKSVLRTLCGIVLSKYNSIGNYSLVSLIISIVLNPEIANEVVLCFLDMYLLSEIMNESLLFMIVSSFSHIAEALIYLNIDISKDNKNKISKVIILGLLSSIVETRRLTLTLIEILKDRIDIANVVNYQSQIISKIGYDSTFNILNELGLLKGETEQLQFYDIIRNNSSHLYFHYLSSLGLYLSKNNIEIAQIVSQEIISYSVSIFDCSKNFAGFMNLLSLISPFCGNHPSMGSMISSFFLTATETKKSDLIISAVLLLSDSQTFGYTIQEISSRYTNYNLAGIIILEKVTLDDKFLDMNTPVFSNNLQAFYNECIEFINGKNFFVNSPKFNSNTSIIDSSIFNQIFLYCFSKSFFTLFKKSFSRMKSTNGLFAINHYLDDQYVHGVENLSSFYVFFNACSINSRYVYSKFIRDAFSYWCSICRIPSNFLEIVLNKSVYLNDHTPGIIYHILCRNFSICFPYYLEHSPTNGVFFYAICSYFSFSIEEKYEQMINFDILNILKKNSGVLIALSFRYLLVGNFEQRKSVFQFLSGLTLSLNICLYHSNLKSKIIHEFYSKQNMLCSDYIDINPDVIVGISKCVSESLPFASEMFIEAILDIQTAIETTSKPHSKSSSMIAACPPKRNEIMKSFILSSKYQIDLLYKLMVPWLNFSVKDFNKKGIILEVSDEFVVFSFSSLIEKLILMQNSQSTSDYISPVVEKVFDFLNHNEMLSFLFTKYLEFPELSNSIRSLFKMLFSYNPIEILSFFIDLLSVKCWFRYKSESFLNLEKEENTKKNVSNSYKSIIKSVLVLMKGLMDENSYFVNQYKHRVLSGCLILYPKCPDECLQVLSLLTDSTDSAQNRAKKTNIIDQYQRGSVATFRNETLKFFFSSFSRIQLIDLKTFLLEWSLCCPISKFSIPSLILLNVLDIEVTIEEARKLSDAIKSLEYSIICQTDIDVVDQKDVQKLFQIREQSKLAPLDILYITESLKLIAKSSLIDNDLKRFIYSHLQFSEPNQLKVFEVSIKFVMSQIEQNSLIGVNDLVNIIPFLYSELIDESLLPLVHQILIHLLISGKTPKQSLLVFSLAPFVWGHRNEKSDFQNFYNSIESNFKTLLYLSNSKSSDAFVEFHNNSISDLDSNDIQNVALLFSRIIAYGNPLQAEAAYQLLTILLNKGKIPNQLSHVYFAILYSINVTYSSLEETAAAFLRSAIQRGYYKVKTSTQRKKRPFPRTFNIEQYDTDSWNQHETSFDDIAKYPPFILYDGSAQASSYVANIAKKMTEIPKR